MTTNAMHCATFDERLADYLEGDLPAAERREMDGHLASCLRCTSLVRDLERMRVDAAALPVLAPSADLWEGIAARIEAPVVPLTAPAVPDVAARRRWNDRARLAAVAAALVAVTAGVTYTVTVATSRAPGQSGNVASATSQPASTPGTGPVQARTARDGATPSIDAARVASVGTARERDQVPAGAREPRPATQPVRNAPAAVTYSREIDRLRAIFTQNRQQLDPRTAAIIEANLEVIDEAIAQSRAALAQDPANRFLDERLNSALDKKLELLRTAALLPNRAT